MAFPSTFFGWASLYYGNPTSKANGYVKASDGNIGAAACMRMQYINDICSNGSKIVAVGRGLFDTATVTINGDSYDSHWYNKGIDGAASLVAPKVYTIAYSNNGGQNWYYYGYTRTDTNATTGGVFKYEGLTVSWNGAVFIATGRDTSSDIKCKYITGTGATWSDASGPATTINSIINDTIWTEQDRVIYAGGSTGNTTLGRSDGMLPTTTTAIDSSSQIFSSDGKTLAIRRRG